MLDRIRSLLAVAEEGSLNRAAVRLRLSQPALSRQMQALEHELGGALLERHSAGVRLTHLGNEAVRLLGPLAAAVESACAQIRQQARGHRAELRVGYLGSAARRYLTPALVRLREREPGVRVRLEDQSPGEQIAALRAGQIDVGLIGQEGRALSREFYTRKFDTLRLVAALPTRHALARRRSIPLAALRGEVFVGALDREVPGRNRWIQDLCRKAGFRTRFVADGGSITETFALIAAEGAVTLLPDYFAREERPGVALVPVADAWAVWDFLVVWQRGALAPALRALVEALQPRCRLDRAPPHAPGKPRKPAAD